MSAPLPAGIHTPPGTRGRHPLDGQPNGQTPPGQTHPPWTDPPAQCMMGYGQQAGGTHPTGMHSCLPMQSPFCKLSLISKKKKKINSAVFLEGSKFLITPNLKSNNKGSGNSHTRITVMSN